MGAVTADQGEGEALIVFRDPREARDFRERTATESYKLAEVTLEGLRTLLDKRDLGWVVVPKPRTGRHVADVFTARAFVEMLDEDLQK